MDLKIYQEFGIDKAKNTHYNNNNLFLFIIFEEKCNDEEEYIVFGSKERRWTVKISVKKLWK